MPDEMVITPGGIRPRSSVHLIERDALVDGAGGHHRIVGAAGASIAEIARVETRPDGVALHPATGGKGSCVTFGARARWLTCSGRAGPRARCGRSLGVRVAACS
jgi:hypothetical protein